MFHHILVPLDGSTRAEQAIPVAAQIARATGGSVVLLQVNTVSTDSAWPALEAPFATPVDLAAEHKEITRYLMRLAALEVLEGIGIATVVVDGIPAQAILSVAQERQVDLIVLSSRGYSGFMRWRLGSVAQKVARHSPIPVLVLREGAGIPTNLHPEGLRPVRVMVPLDGSDLSEAVLSPAATLSAALSEPLAGQLHLVQVLSLPLMNHRYHSEQMVAARARIQADARTYLEAVQQRMQASETAGSKLEVSTSLIMDEDVAGGLIRAAEGEQQGQDAQEDYSLACDGNTRQGRHGALGAGQHHRARPGAYAPAAADPAAHAGG